MNLKLRLMLGFIKLFNKPSISEPVKPGKWYRIPLLQCVCGGCTPVHACIRTGTENKWMVVLYREGYGYMGNFETSAQARVGIERQAAFFDRVTK